MQKLFDRVQNLVAPGLVVSDGGVNDPGPTHHLTEGGVAELGSGTVVTPPVREAQPEAQVG